nr:carbohydrate binding domain-containing protein [Clostridia bacterium]
SMSYFEDDVKTLIREAQKILPEDSHPYRVIDRMFELYATYPDNWRTACVIAEEENFRNHYDLNVVRGETGINCSFMVLGLLYGDGDYYEPCKIISLAGHGGDSTTPGPLSIIGIITGWKDLDADVKKVINEKIWQDGKAVLVNLPIASMAEGYHMYCGGLPERITIAELLDLYQANFENILKENGGFIKDGYYYIPKSDINGLTTLLAEDFEGGSLDGYKTLGTASTTDAAYSGKVSAKVSGNDKSDSEIYAVVDGLTVGKTYRASAFVSTSASTAATVFARDAAKKNVVYADIYDQSAFVKRVIEFTATATTMEIGISLPKGTASHRYAIMDELTVTEADVKSAGAASILDAAANNTYNGKFTVDVNANNTKENYIVLTFANTSGKTLNTKVSVNGADAFGVPFYKTGTTAKEAANTVYIPVLAKGESNFTVEFTFDGKLSVYSAKLVEKMY